MKYTEKSLNRQDYEGSLFNSVEVSFCEYFLADYPARDGEKILLIDRIYYPVLTLGHGRRVGIWTVGCPHACKNCSNPELWDSDPAKDVPVDVLINYIDAIKQPIDGITITGGEPFIQLVSLDYLVSWLSDNLSKDIMVYTGFTLTFLRGLADVRVDRVLERIAVLIDGRYEDELNDGTGLRGSSNQTVHILNTAYEPRRQELESGLRRMQNVFWGDNLLSIGIPQRGFRAHFGTELIKHGIVEEDWHGGESTQMVFGTKPV